MPRLRSQQHACAGGRELEEASDDVPCIHNFVRWVTWGCGYRILELVRAARNPVATATARILELWQPGIPLGSAWFSGVRNPLVNLSRGNSLLRLEDHGDANINPIPQVFHGA
jgi:hypothetical protein